MKLTNSDYTTHVRSWSPALQKHPGAMNIGGPGPGARNSDSPALWSHLQRRLPGSGVSTQVYVK